MSYHTILVHADRSRHTAARVRLAARLARAAGAHLIGLAATGLSRYVYQSGIAYGMPILPSDITQLTERAAQDLREFDRLADAEGVLSYEARLVDDESEGGLVLQSRYADLLVVGQVDPDEPANGLLDQLPAYLMLHSARPVLIVPYAGVADVVGTRPLIAWDGSMAATRAISAALPLLRRAERAVLAVFNSGAAYGVHGEEPGADMALFLARHGVKVEVQASPTPVDVGDALLSLAADLQSDLLVMGGYGHTRFRETCLGGVTRTVMRTMTLPVLMAH